MKVQIRLAKFKYKDGKTYEKGDTLIFDENDIKQYNKAIYTEVVENEETDLPDGIEWRKGWYVVVDDEGNKIKGFRTIEEAEDYVDNQ